MTEKLDLEIRLESAIREAQENYDSAMATVEKLKEEMNEMERRIDTESKRGNAADMAALSALTRRFNELTDSQIQKSKEAWQKYGELKREFETQATKTPQLADFHETCTRTQQLATDLTCYSLGNPKR
jgi:phage shock protein A